MTGQAVITKPAAAFPTYGFGDPALVFTIDDFLERFGIMCVWPPHLVGDGTGCAGTGERVKNPIPGGS